MTILLKAVAITVLFTQAAEAAPTSGPQSLFDQEGHFIACQYSDGTMDQYTYDSKWRMNTFRGRNKVKTRFIYKADGSMSKETVGPFIK